MRFGLFSLYCEFLLEFSIVRHFVSARSSLLGFLISVWFNPHPIPSLETFCSDMANLERHLRLRIYIPCVIIYIGILSIICIWQIWSANVISLSAITYNIIVIGSDLSFLCGCVQYPAKVITSHHPLPIHRPTSTEYWICNRMDPSTCTVQSVSTSPYDSPKQPYGIVPPSYGWDRSPYDIQAIQPLGQHHCTVSKQYEFFSSPLRLPFCLLYEFLVSTVRAIQTDI